MFVTRPGKTSVRSKFLDSLRISPQIGHLVHVSFRGPLLRGLSIELVVGSLLRARCSAVRNNRQQGTHVSKALRHKRFTLEAIQRTRDRTVTITGVRFDGVRRTLPSPRTLARTSLAYLPASSAASHSSMSRRRLASNKPVLLRQVALPPMPSFSAVSPPLTGSLTITKTPVIRTPKHSPLYISSLRCPFPFSKNETGFVFPITPEHQVASILRVPPGPPAITPRRPSKLDLTSQRMSGNSELASLQLCFTPLESPASSERQTAGHRPLPHSPHPFPAIEAGNVLGSDQPRLLCTSSRSPGSFLAFSRSQIPNRVPLALHLPQMPPGRVHGPRTSLRIMRIGLPRRLSYNRCASSPLTPSHEDHCGDRTLDSPAAIPGAYIHSIPRKCEQARTAPGSSLPTPVETPQTSADVTGYFALR